LVFIDLRDRNLVKARNESTKLIEHANQDATQVIQYAIGALSNGGKIMIQRGTYTLSSSLQSNGINGIELYGEGNLTVLRLANAVNDSVIHLSGVKDWHVHDLQVDGNKVAQSSTSQSCCGISAWNCTNIVLERNYVHDCRTFGIEMSYGSNSKVLNNYVTNSGANGITIDNEEGGGGITVQGNVVDGASDVGITAWVGSGLLIAGNQIMNVMNKDSPFGSNSGVGMMAEGTDTLGSTGVTYSGNTVTNCVGPGFSSVPGANAFNTDISVENNQISNCGRGVYVERTNGLGLQGNLIDTISDRGIVVDSGASGVQIVSNQLYNIQGASGIEAVIGGLLIDGNTLKTLAGHGIVAWGYSDWKVTNNHIESAGNSGVGSGIVLGSGSNNWSVSTNMILRCGADGILVDPNSNHNTIDHNRVSGCATGVRISSQAENNIVTSNILQGNRVDLLDDGTGTLKADNVVGSE
jgi:parallel beta-helix repeat protein